MCKLKKGFSPFGYFFVSAVLHAAVTAADVLWFHCHGLVPLILAVNFLPSLIFTDALVRMRYYTAGIHAFLFTASRIIVTTLLGIISNKSIPVFSNAADPASRIIPVCVITISFLLTCLFERIARNACTVDGARAPEFTPKILTYLCIAVTVFLVFTLCESAIEGHGAASARMVWRSRTSAYACFCTVAYGCLPNITQLCRISNGQNRTIAVSVRNGLSIIIPRKPRRLKKCVVSATITKISSPV